MRFEECDAILGAPFNREALRDRFEFDDDEIEFVEGVTTAYYKHYGEFHGQTELTYLNESLVSMHFIDAEQPLRFRDIDLFAKEHKKTVSSLFEADNEVYADSEALFFAQSGVITTRPKFWTEMPYIRFVLSRFELDRIDFNLWEQIEKLPH